MRGHVKLEISFDNGRPVSMKLLQKIIIGVWLFSTIAAPLLGVGFNLVYLYVHFSGRFRWWWNSRCARIVFYIFVGDIAISIITQLCNKVILAKMRQCRREESTAHQRKKEITEAKEE